MSERDKTVPLLPCAAAVCGLFDIGAFFLADRFDINCNHRRELRRYGISVDYRLFHASRECPLEKDSPVGAGDVFLCLDHRSHSHSSSRSSIPYFNTLLCRLNQSQYRRYLLLFFLFDIALPAFGVLTYFANAQILFFALVYSIGGYLLPVFPESPDFCQYVHQQSGGDFRKSIRDFCCLQSD